jgi:hypothetical protein
MHLSLLLLEDRRSSDKSSKNNNHLGYARLAICNKQIKLFDHLLYHVRYIFKYSSMEYVDTSVGI